MARGGYQQPSNPAPVSGPGALSKRTDGGPGQGRMQLPDAAYGEQKDFQQIQAGAAMEEAAQPQVIPLSEPTMRPDEPVTHGSPSGPGGGPEAIGLSASNAGQSKLDAQQLAAYLPALIERANQPGVPTSFVRFVRYLRASQ